MTPGYYPAHTADDPLWREAERLRAENAMLREALEAIARNAEAWHGGEEAKARALTVIAKWANDPATIPAALLAEIRVALAASPAAEDPQPREADLAAARRENATLREAAQALYEQVEMDESVGVCLSDRVPSLRLGDVLAATEPASIDSGPPA